MRASRAIRALAPALILLLGCEDNGSPQDDMVIVAGVVRNVDDGSEASGVRVRLYGTKYADEVPTGSDGAFELRVPRGSKLLFHTDDFDPADDVWFPLINVDIVPIFATDDIYDFPIHCCPHDYDPAMPLVGSVKIWDNYLANCDDTENGDVFEPVRAQDANGIMTLLFVNCMFSGPDSLEITVTPSEVPVAIWRNEAFDQSLGPPRALECRVFHPASRNCTDEHWSGAQSFLGSSFTGNSVRVTVKDLKASRGISFPASFDVPVAAGTISLVISGIDAGRAVTFPEIAQKCGWFNP